MHAGRSLSITTSSNQRSAAIYLRVHTEPSQVPGRLSVPIKRYRIRRISLA